MRRRRLLGAAKHLLERCDPPDLTFAAICASARVPPGSARFFYRDVHELLRALLADMMAEHDAALLRPFRPGDVATWRSLVECLIERSARFHRGHPVYAKLTISGQTLPDLKRMDRDADRVRSDAILALLNEYFVVPRTPHLQNIAYLNTEVVDVAFTLSMKEAGRITPQWLSYAKEAATALLAHFLGGEMERRPVVDQRAFGVDAGRDDRRRGRGSPARSTRRRRG